MLKHLESAMAELEKLREEIEASIESKKSISKPVNIDALMRCTREELARNWIELNQAILSMDKDRIEKAMAAMEEAIRQIK